MGGTKQSRFDAFFKEFNEHCTTKGNFHTLHNLLDLRYVHLLLKQWNQPHFIHQLKLVCPSVCLISLYLAYRPASFETLSLIFGTLKCISQRMNADQGSDNFFDHEILYNAIFMTVGVV